MKLTPLDIRKQEFPRVLRGWDPEEVQAFLMMVSTQLEEHQNETRHLEARLREAESRLSHYHKVEEALEEALRTARESAQQSVETARLKAQAIITDAQLQAADLLKDVERARQNAVQEMSALDQRRQEIAVRLRSFLMSEVELLKRFEDAQPEPDKGDLPVESEVQVGPRGGAYLGRMFGRDEETEAPPSPQRSTFSRSTEGAPVARQVGLASEKRGSENGSDASGPTPLIPLHPQASEGRRTPIYQLPATEEGVEDTAIERELPVQDSRPSGSRWVVHPIVSPSAPAEPEETQISDDVPDGPSELPSSEEMERIRRILKDLE